jgi:hypothetical protein
MFLGPLSEALQDASGGADPWFPIGRARDTAVGSQRVFLSESQPGRNLSREALVILWPTLRCGVPMRTLPALAQRVMSEGTMLRIASASCTV